MINEHMMKTGKLVDYRIPYVILVSKLIEHFEVDLEDELVEVVKPHNEITTATLHKIGLKNINNEYWICRADEDEMGQQSNKGEGVGQQEDEAGPSVTVAATGGGSFDATAIGGFALVPYAPSVDRGEPFLRFEQMVLSRLNTIVQDQRSHHEFCTSRFQHLDGQVEPIQEQLGDMYYGQPE